MSSRDFIVFDFETGGRDPHSCQLTQLAAVALDGRTLRSKGTFNQEIWAETDDEKAVEKGLAPIEEEALKVTGKNREDIAKATPIETVWPKFVDFVNKCNWKGNEWFAPIACGYNIINFDLPIIHRLCKQHGPWNEKKGQAKLFHPIFKVDMMDNVFMWTESDPSIKSIGMDAMRKRMGMSDDNAHDALQDVKDTANIMIKFMKTHRAVYKNTLSDKIDGAFTTGALYVK